MTLGRLIATGIVWAGLAGMSISGATCSVVIHRLDYSPQYSELVLNLPVGVAMVAEPESDLHALASAYRSALNHQSAPPSANAKRSIVAAGPLLDSPDEVQIQECRREGDVITLRIIHTSARLRGAGLRRNIPFRPLVELPVAAGGRYVVEVGWQAMESLPNGKRLAEPVVVGPLGLR